MSLDKWHIDDSDAEIVARIDDQNYIDLSFSADLTACAYIIDAGTEIYIKGGTPIESVPVETWAAVRRVLAIYYASSAALTPETNHDRD